MAGLDIIGDIIGGIASVVGSSINTKSASDIADKNIAMQEDFAKHGLSWKVDDAIAAGINPLAALGAQLNSFSNIVGAENPGAGVSALGQNISRAMHAMQDPEEKAAAEAKTALDLERMGLQNDVLKQQLASNLRVARQPGSPPGLVKVEPSKVVAARPSGPEVEAGSTPDASIVRSTRGYALLPGEGVSSRLQTGFIPGLQWFLRNSMNPPKVEGYRYNPYSAEYYPGDNPRGSPYTGMPWLYDYREPFYKGD